MKVVIDSDDWGWDRKDLGKGKESDQDVANLLDVLKEAGAVMTCYMVMKDFELTDVWQQGIYEGLINPQLHGFEHNNKFLVLGVNRFEMVFKQQPKTYTAPYYKWSKRDESNLGQYGIKQISTVRVANKRFFYTGKRNNFGQTYRVRNAFLEGIHSPDMCMDQIRWAFFWNKPAVICTHRINYVNSRNLANLKELLKQINKTWPDVQYQG